MTVPFSASELGIAMAAEMFGAIVQGTTGFGVNLVSVPILVLLNPAFVPAPTLFANLVLSLGVIVRDRAAVDRDLLRWGLAGRVPGTALGALLVAWMTRNELAFGASSIIIVGVVLSLAKVCVAVTSRTSFVAGSIAGIMSTAASVGGPPLALLYQNCPGPKVRGTIAAHAIGGALLSLVFLGLVGHFGLEDVVRGCYLLPGLAVGFAVSGPLARRLDRGHTRRAAIGVSGATALVGLLHVALQAR